MNLEARQPRIFVVDDEFVISSTLAMILTKNGFDAISFTAPAEALRAGQTQAPDLLISDVVMPGMSGIELAILMKRVSPNCRILLFSGQATTADLLEAAREQGHEFELLSKPIHPAQFIKKIKEVNWSVS